MKTSNDIIAGNGSAAQAEKMKTSNDIIAGNDSAAQAEKKQ